MPQISLAVCVRNEVDLLARLLATASGCYDDLIVVHDGPEQSDRHHSIQQLVAEHQGQFFAQALSFQQETHWPFAWSRGKHNWILRLDADEVPSVDLTQWLSRFRTSPEPASSVSGYTCIWPLWNGHRIVTKHWPAGRIFLFHKGRVRFFGMNEQLPVPDGKLESLPLVLEHRPERKSYGVSNLLFRSQAYRWRQVIAQSLVGKPTDLHCWRWTSEEWPMIWEEIRQRPLRTGVYRLVMWPLFNLRQMTREEGRFIFSAVAFTGVHHFLVALIYWRLRLSRDKHGPPLPKNPSSH
jgi:hypothetical protein